jgi:hypothetical protein
MKLRLGGNLEVGDPIVVSYGSGIDFGIFAGYGRGTIQYYTPSGVIYHANLARGRNEKPKFRKAYIHGERIKYRVAKVNKHILYNEEDAKDYKEAIEILKQENVIQ